MPATFALSGALNAFQGGNDTGAASTGIGTASNRSGQVTGNFTVAAADFVAQHIGGGTVASAGSNTGQIVQEPIVITAGSGYTNGTYRLQSNAAAPALAGAAEIEFTVAGGAVTAARVVRPGSNFTAGAPTWTIANAINTNGTGAGPGAGTLGAFVTTVGLGSRANMLGTGFGTNKGTQLLAAAGAVAIDAAVTPSSYLNRSGRALVAGDQVWAVAP